ncbi:MAG: hypothetical protein R3211_09730 [Balneolaceae bacterium]|nr:hypothetical protein [Balneolaceae bacterium]
MAFKLNHEKATDVLIWWVEAADGSIDYREREAVKRVLEDMDYSLETFYQETIMHIGGLSTENVKELAKKAIQYGSDNFSESRKKLTLMLLETIANSTGEVTPEQREKLDHIEKEFGMD